MDPDSPGGTIILITDGKENERPFLSDFQPMLESQVIITNLEID